MRAADLDKALEALNSTGRRLISSGSPYEPTIGFSRAVREGDRVLVSGTGPVMADGGCPESTYEQAKRAWEIVAKALNEAGATVDDVVRTRTYLTPEADYDGAMKAHGEVFGDVRPGVDDARHPLAARSALDRRGRGRSSALTSGRTRKSPPKPGVRMSRMALSGDVLST